MVKALIREIIRGKRIANMCIVEGHDFVEIQFKEYITYHTYYNVYEIVVICC